MSEREILMPSEAAFDWISDQLRRDGNFAATIANSSLYQECGRSADAFDAVAELVEPIVRTAVEKALAEQEARHKREVLEAKIDTLTAHGDCVCPIYSVYGERLSAVDPECVVCSALKRLESELAALEVKP